MKLGVAIKDVPDPTPNVGQQEPFTKEGLLKRLIEFVTSDDQVLNYHDSLKAWLADENCRR